MGEARHAVGVTASFSCDHVAEPQHKTARKGEITSHYFTMPAFLAPRMYRCSVVQLCLQDCTELLGRKGGAELDTWLSVQGNVNVA